MATAQVRRIDDRDDDEASNNPLLTRPVLWFLLFSIVSNASLSLLFAALPLFAEIRTGNALGGRARRRGR